MTGQKGSLQTDLLLHVSLIGTCLPPSLGISPLPKAGLVPSALPQVLQCHWGPRDVVAPQTCSLIASVGVLGFCPGN